MKKPLSNAFGKVFVTVDYLPAYHVVCNTWVGYQTYSGIVYGADICLEVLAQQRCPYLLNDNSLVSGPWDHAVEWISRDWAPRAAAAGLTHFAHVASPDSFAHASAKAMLTGIQAHFHMQLFSTPADALAWLRQAQTVLVGPEQGGK